MNKKEVAGFVWHVFMFTIMMSVSGILIITGSAFETLETEYFEEISIYFIILGIILIIITCVLMYLWGVKKT